MTSQFSSVKDRILAFTFGACGCVFWVGGKVLKESIKSIERKGTIREAGEKLKWITVIKPEKKKKKS